MLVMIDTKIALERSLWKYCTLSDPCEPDCVIEQYMKGKDVFFCSPTGSGKSLVFEMGPFLFQYLEKTQQCTCIVILAALMELQVDGFLLELHQWGGSNEYPQFIFCALIKQRLQISHKIDILQLNKLFVT